MFGPQARAAELQAVRSAAMRQRTQVVEGQIPIPAPVSLTDFARPQPISRNKGSKQYRSLNLEDVETLTPDGNSSPVGDLFSPGLGISFPLRETPKAPKAMVDSSASSPSTRRSKKRPARLQSKHLLFDGQFAPAVLEEKFADVPVASSPAAIAGATSSVQRLSSAGVMLLDFDQDNSHNANLHLDRLESPQFLQATMEQPSSILRAHHYEHAQPRVSSPQRYGMSQEDNGAFIYEPNVPSFHPESFHSLTVTHRTPHFQRSCTFAEDILSHENRLQEMRREGLQRTEPTYDRNSKMQNFVAAQQAMAKTGRTVLHNPQILTPGPPTDSYGSPQSRSRAMADSRPGESNSDDFDHSTAVETIQSAMVSESQIESWARGSCNPMSGDPIASGFTPAPRTAVSAIEILGQENACAEESSSPIHRKKIEECPAIQRMMRKRNGPEMTGSDRPPSNEVKGGAVEPTVVQPSQSHQTSQTGQQSKIQFPTDDDTGSWQWCALRSVTRKDATKLTNVRMALLEGELTIDFTNGLEQGAPVCQPAINTMQIPAGEAIQNNGLPEMSQIARPAFESPIAVNRVEDSDNLRTPNGTKSVTSSQSAGRYKDSLSATRVRLSYEGQMLASPPARLARDPRYRPLSAQTAMQAGLRHW